MRNSKSLAFRLLIGFTLLSTVFLFQNCNAPLEQPLTQSEPDPTIVPVDPGSDLGDDSVLDQAPRPKSFPIELASPMDWQVFQRGDDNKGSILVAGALPQSVAKVKVELHLKSALYSSKEYSRSEVEISDHEFRLNAPAEGSNGWYLVVVSFEDYQGFEIGKAIVPRVGIGEVFITAGQSNATKSGESAQENHLLTSYGDFSNGKLQWRQRIDLPGELGSPWGPFASELASKLRVQVSIIMVGCGGTFVREWLPLSENPRAPLHCTSVRTAGGLYERLKQAALAQGSFRAVLWHQGEMDVSHPDGVENYYSESMIKIIHQLDVDLGRKVPWLVANAAYVPGADVDRDNGCKLTGKSHHPQKVLDMEALRREQQKLWSLDIAYPGPDTDTLVGGEYRGFVTASGYKDSCIHFNNKGLRAHGHLWFEAVEQIFF